jgi:hypothetical protein
MKTVIALILVLGMAVPVMAQHPVNGTWKSSDLGGTVLTGTYSEYWPGGTKLSVNNTLNEQSWDGANLGTQWWWYCPWQALPAALQYDGVDANGNGIKIWRIDYTGGYIWLDGSGPWGGGDASYLALVDIWTEVVTETYVNFVEVGTVRTQNVQASFQGYSEDCMNLSLANKEKHGDTNGGTLPAGYPNFWEGANCADAGTAGPGEWGEVDEITLSVTGCTVPVENKTWGAVKKIYSE